MKLRFFHYPKMAYFIPFRVKFVSWRDSLMYRFYNNKTPMVRWYSLSVRLGWHYFSVQLQGRENG